MSCKIVQGKIQKSTREDKQLMRVVKKVCDGKVVREITVHFWDPNMPEKSKSKYGRKAFHARHNCDQKTDPFTPGYQSCKVLW